MYVYSPRLDMGVSMNGGIPIAGWFIMENPTKMDDLGVPLFQETSICACMAVWVGGLEVWEFINLKTYITQFQKIKIDIIIKSLTKNT